MNTNKIIQDLKKLKLTFPDLIIKQIKLGLFKSVYIVTTESLSSTDKINNFIYKYFSNKSLIKNTNLESLKKDIKNYIPSINSKEVKSEKEFYYLLFNGYTIVLSSKTILAFETRAELDRGITEPTSEPISKGPKDSFTENYNKNLGLIRKRIKSTSLFNKEVIIGRETSSKCGLLYMNNIAEKTLVNKVYQKLKKIDIDGILDITNLKELLIGENQSIFPTMMNTERPENACKALLDGKIVLIMENSPNVLIIPTLFIDYFQNGEDYSQKAFFASFIRIIRIIAFGISIITPAFYIGITTYDQEMLPTSLLINFATQRDGVPFPAIIEAIILMISFEILNEGDSRVPATKATSLSILGALVLGEAAVNAGIVSPIMVIVIAITSISTLLFSFYDVNTTIRFWRYFLLLFAAFFGIIGVVIGLCIMLIKLSTIKSFGKPYLMPITPFYKDSFSNAIIKRKTINIKKRKKYLTDKNFIRSK